MNEPALNIAVLLKFCHRFIADQKGPQFNRSTRPIPEWMAER